MHSSASDLDAPRLGGAEVLVALAALVTEGRTPNTIASHTSSTKARGGFSEGPHCTASKASHGHICNHENQLCIKYDRMRSYVISLWQKSLPLCIDVLLVPKCCCENDLICNPSTSLEPIGSAVLLEQWHVTVLHRRTHDFPSNFNTNQLINAIRSQLYFSQISAWLAAPDDKIRTTFSEQCVVVYCLTVPGESYGCTKFASCSQQHTFPTADIGNGVTLKVSLANLPRSEEVPTLKCSKCDVPMAVCETNIAVLDDRMQTSCTLKGKHRCEDYDELENCCSPRYKKREKNYLNLDASGDASVPSTSRNLFSNLSNQTPLPASSKSKLQLNFPTDAKLNFEADAKLPEQTRKKPFEKCESSKVDLELSKKEFVEVLSVLRQSQPIKNTKKNDLSKGDILLGAILRSSAKVQPLEKEETVHQDLKLKLATDSVKSKVNLQENGVVNMLNGVTHQETSKSMEFVHCDAVTNGITTKECPLPVDKPSLTENTTTANDFNTISKHLNTRDAIEENFYKNKQFLDRHTCGVNKMAAKLSELSATNCTERNKRKCSKSGARECLNAVKHDNIAMMKMRNCDKFTCDTVQNNTLSIIQLLRSDQQRMIAGSKCSVNNNHSSNSISSSSNSNSGRFNLNDIYTEVHCDNLVKRKKTEVQRMCDISNVFSLEYLERRQKVKVKQKITFDSEEVKEDVKKTEDFSIKEQPCNAGIPSALEQAKFRKSLDSAASMVFHSRTGLPLTSSPAPVRRGKSCFDFDSSINSVSAIRSALFSLASCSTDEDSESDCSIVSPCSPDAVNGLQQREIPPVKYRHRGQSSGLLGSFVESVLNGRLEPVSTVHGFSAELGASGSFCPRHVVLPVTVFFYTLGDNDKVSTPYLGHINLGKKGYNVPKSGTIQVTLFNPLGTVVKMFVIMYDLSDMPANSQTFIRQRTLFMPANCEGRNLEWSQKWLRYLIHLRFMSSKSGRIYLHSDIRMIICRKSDLDTATAHGIDMSYELRSFTHSPTNPKFSPRK